jgi:bifunctional UDP-N-acetylglucosamine pyrophosphorylase/glucosamine-1-phosphate N-acetyltransferase
VAAPTRSRSLAAVVLAAGKGKRLKSSSPKVLHPVCGRPVLWWAIREALAARPAKLVVVVHHGADEVRETVRSWKLRPEPVFVEQGEALGTGHAVLAAEKAIGRVDEVLVANGDFDPVTADDVRALLRLHRSSKAAATLITTELERPGRYSRIVREGSRLVSIVEGSDACSGARTCSAPCRSWGRTTVRASTT